MYKRSLLIFLAIVFAFGIISMTGCTNSEKDETTDTTEDTTENATENATKETTEDAGPTNWITAEDISSMPETTIRYWFYESPELTELGKKQIEEFMKLNPNIKVEGKTAPEAVDNQQLLSFIKTHNNSHVQHSVNNEDLWYIDHDVLFPIDNFPDYKDVLARLNPDLNYTWKDGHVYSLSWYHSPMLLYYNKKLLVEAGLDPNNLPTTYDDFLVWAEKLTKPGKQWALAPWLYEDWWSWEFMLQPYYIAATGSSQVVSEDGKTAVFNTPNGIEPYKLFEQLFKKGYATKSSFEGDPFISGQVAITLDGSWLNNDIKRNASEGFEYVVGPIPKPAGSSVEGNPTFGFVRNFALVDEDLPDGEEKDRINRASWEFMKFLLSEDQMVADYTVSGNFPSAADLNSNPVFTAITDTYGPEMKKVIELGENSQIGDMNSTKEVDLMDFLNKAYLNVAHGKMTAEEAVAEAEQKVNELLSKE